MSPLEGAVSQFEDVSRSGRQLWEATFTALERLVRLCERKGPILWCFLPVISTMGRSPALRGLPVLPCAMPAKGSRRMAFPSLLPTATMIRLHHALQPLEWPSNVVFFRERCGRRIRIQKTASRSALVHGISGASSAEGRNPARGSFRQCRQFLFPPRCPALFPLMTATVTPPVRNRIWFQRTGCLGPWSCPQKANRFQIPQLPISGVSRACISMSRGQRAAIWLPQRRLKAAGILRRIFVILGPCNGKPWRFRPLRRETMDEVGKTAGKSPSARKGEWLPRNAGLLSRGLSCRGIPTWMAACTRPTPCKSWPIRQAS